MSDPITATSLNFTTREKDGPSNLLLSLPHGNTTFFSNSAQEIIRITADGRLEKGPGLSDDAASLLLFECCKKTFGGKIKEMEEKLAKESARLDWLERKHAESNGKFYEVECSITHNGNTGARPLFSATRAGIDEAMKEDLQ